MTDERHQEYLKALKDEEEILNRRLKRISSHVTNITAVSFCAQSN